MKDEERKAETTEQEENEIQNKEVEETKKRRGRKKENLNSPYFAKNLRILRKSQKWTQDGIAKLLGLSRMQYARYELGSQEPSVKMLADIVKVYNITITDILSKDLSKTGHLDISPIKPPDGMQLTRKQRISKGRNRTRKLTNDELTRLNLIRLSSYSKVRLLGSIVAGIPIETQEDFEGYVLTTYGPEEEYFALRVNGNSMINAGIPDKSIVIVHKQDTVENGEIAVCLINNEATVKRVKFIEKQKLIVLQPENSEFSPILVFEYDNFMILGKVVQVQINI